MVSRLRIGIDWLSRLAATSDAMRIAFVAICAAISFGMYFPGKLEPDSILQLREALNGHFTDGNPPIMAALWRILSFGAPGPAVMLAVHVALYWTGVWACWDAVARKPEWRSFLPLLAALHPLVLVSLGIILRDCAMAVSLLAAFGLLFRRRTLGHPATFAGSVFIGLLLAYAALVRWNGMFAVAPVLLYWARSRWTQPVRVIGVTALLVIAFMPVFLFVSHTLLRAAPTHLEVALQIFDVAGIQHYSGDGRPLALRPGCYTSYYWDSLESAKCGRLFEQVTGATEFGATDARPGAMPAKWVQAIRDHPFAYLRHRISYFNSSTYFIVPPALICKLAPAYGRCELPKQTLIFRDFLRKNFLYWPCVWLAAGAWLALRSRSDPAVRALGWSGVLYGTAYLFIGVGSDWRYHLWTELSVAMAIALHFALAGPSQRRTSEFLWCVAPVVVLGYGARFFFLLSGW